MKNSIALISFLCVLAFAEAQNSHVTDTILASDKKVVSLFFPNPIRQGITGSPKYAFSFNRDKEQSFGLLQATPGEESNLLVVTSDGKVYSYLLHYSQELDKLSYFIAASESIGNEKSGSAHKHKPKKVLVSHKTLQDTIKTTDYSKLSSQLLKNPLPFNQLKNKKGISIRMTKSFYYDHEVFILFEIANNSSIDFEINSLNLFKVTGNKRRKASYQELLLSPVYLFKIPRVVLKGQKVQFICVYPKFTLGTNEKLIVKLDELNGSRDVVWRLRL
ncbi:DUF4138 domain-containing protein [Arenibacter sp. 6A1]|uniref:DUF4138 domain-containing protein n=1 Tax=Arenibacter sp. 6A1 TaxID=2720391 RepID=UPI0014463E11|nr:DUF4138 domain-containing protein [Arenibacter sp. 6A1]NKI28292.1 DUF4138 domain-containing protein [Arenibacter sp. 6A1]